MSSEPAGQLASLIASASAAFESGDLPAAENSIQLAFELAGGNLPAQACWIRGLIRSRQGRYAEALSFLEPLIGIAGLRNYAALYKALFLAAWGAREPAKAVAAGRRALEIEPMDHALRNDLLGQMAVRAIPITEGDLEAALRSLASVPLSPQFPNIYRVCALTLATKGEKDRAFDLYYPVLEQLVRRKDGRIAWYNYASVEEGADMESQSQRFREGEEAIEAEFAHVSGELALSPGDSVADIGGAGGLYSKRLAAIAREVLLTDVSEALVEKASRQLEDLRNVTCLRHDITVEPLPTPVDKALMCRVTPMLDGWDSFAHAMRNLHGSLKAGGRAFVTNNYDLNGAARALRHALEEPQDRYSTLWMYENMLWLDPESVTRLATEIGFGQSTILNRKQVAGGLGAFDLLLVK